MVSLDNPIRAATRAASGMARVAGWSVIEGAADTTGASIENVGVDHRGGDLLVTEELLDRADVVTGSKRPVAKEWRRAGE